ncbi:MAG: hypothetical protein Q9212_005097, partial [Teloschistes hypoglaucus]
MKCRYIAGHWDFELAKQLCWCVSVASRPTNYRAPSWAWPSVDGTVQLLPYDTHAGWQALIDVLEVQIDLVVEDDEMSPVKGGYLEIYCQLIPMSAPEKGSALLRGLEYILDFYADDETAVLRDPLYFVPILLKFIGDFDRFSLGGFIVQQAGGPGVYKRVGCIFTSDIYHEDHPIVGLIGHRAGHPEAGIPSSLTRTELGMQKIRIV